MKDLLVSFEHANFRFENDRWIFRRHEPLRFEWLALLAYRRATSAPDAAGVSLKDVARLPRWRGRPLKHVATYLGRYLKSSDLAAAGLVTTARPFAGPYSLTLDPFAIRFDIPLDDVRQRLQLRPTPASTTKREDLLRFTTAYIRAQWLFSIGRLKARAASPHVPQSAYEAFGGLADDRRFSSTLRLLAQLSCVDVLFRLGSFKSARKSLLESRKLVDGTADWSLKARFYLALVWSYQRASTSASSNRAVESCLRKAQNYAENSADHSSVGLFLYRKGMYLTKRRRFADAVNVFADAVEAYLVAGNYNSVHAACSGLGSVLHRIGIEQYPEVRRWLLASIAIARLLRVGQDDAHSEMILGKMYVELGRKWLARLMLQRAERVANRAGNRVNLADVKMVWAFWHQRYGTREDEAATLVNALRLFRSMPEFDVPQKENYIRHSFPEVWDKVLAALHSPQSNARA